MHTRSRIERGLVLLLVLGLGLGACSNPDTNAGLEGRIADLEAELVQATSTTPASTPATTSSTAPATTTTTGDPLDPELVRERFGYAMEEAMATSQALLEQDPETVTTIFGTTTYYWFDLEPDWSFDIERTDSIISPFTATATVWFSVTESGGPFSDGTFSLRESADVFWAYQDGEWIVKDARATELDGAKQLISQGPSQWALTIVVASLAAHALFVLQETPQSALDSAQGFTEWPVPTTTIEANDPVDPLSLEDSNLTCSSDAIDISVVITNTSTTTLELTYVGLFPGGGYGHSGWGFPDWWPLPVLEPGETVTHTAVMEIITSKPSEEMELFVSWVAGEASGNEPHPITCG